MQKCFLGSLALATLCSLSVRAENTYTPYIGMDVLYNIAKVSQVKPHYFGANFNVGTMYNYYFGTELFYEQVGSDSKKITDTQKIKTSYRAYGLDASGYLPLGCQKRLNLLGTVGISEYVFYHKIKPEKHHHNSGFGYRAGVGILYHITDHLSLRAAAKYVHFDKISEIDHQMSYQIGVRYHFSKD